MSTKYTEEHMVRRARISRLVSVSAIQNGFAEIGSEFNEDGLVKVWIVSYSETGDRYCFPFIIPDEIQGDAIPRFIHYATGPETVIGIVQDAINQRQQLHDSGITSFHELLPMRSAHF